VDVVALSDAALADGFEIVPVRVDHTFPLASLPDRHGDPFDRLLIAQAIAENRRLITVDEAILAYMQVSVALTRSRHNPRLR
jgi:PIN domain nuclease of toxin-antitoxin system